MVPTTRREGVHRIHTHSVHHEGQVFIIDNWRSRRFKFTEKSQTSYTKLKALVADILKDQQQVAHVPRKGKRRATYTAIPAVRSTRLQAVDIRRLKHDDRTSRKGNGDGRQRKPSPPKHRQLFSKTRSQQQHRNKPLRMRGSTSLLQSQEMELLGRQTLRLLYTIYTPTACMTYNTVCSQARTDTECMLAAQERNGSVALYHLCAPERIRHQVSHVIPLLVSSTSPPFQSTTARSTTCTARPSPRRHCTPGSTSSRAPYQKVQQTQSGRKATLNNHSHTSTKRVPETCA